MTSEQRLAKIAEAAEQKQFEVSEGRMLSRYEQFDFFEAVSILAARTALFIETNKEGIEKGLGVKL